MTGHDLRELREAVVESMLLAQPGVLNAAVNLATNTVQVEYVPGVIDERTHAAQWSEHRLRPPHQK
ncbi:MAG: heavy-metal-associated domain-containing protein [Flavobacteriales bacterium]|nr:heavy-metal-associated domain-containing protein [Flavobacteriales bacterium]